MFLNQHKTKSKDWTLYKKCGRVQFVGEHFEQRYTELNLANNWDFTVLKRSLRCEKNRKFCKIDTLGSNLYRATSCTLYIAKRFKRFSYIKYVYSLLCFFTGHRSLNAEVRPYETVCVVFDKYTFKTQIALLPSPPLAPASKRQEAIGHIGCHIYLYGC